MNVTLSQVVDLLDNKLREAGLSDFVNRKHSQFLDMEDNFFIEVVLDDGAVLEDVEKVVRITEEELKPQGGKLDIIVRAIWEVVQVQYVGPSRTADGGLRAALAFRALLKSGRRNCHVMIDVFWGAMEFLERKLGLKKFVSGQPEATERRHLTEEMANRVVESFLKHQLASGGTGYWNPLSYSELELNESAMSFILGQSTAFEELRQAIADAFDPPVLDSFVKGLSVSRITIKDFDAVLPEFSNMLGGAYRRGGTFSTSASELYGKLQRTEQELLKKYFNSKVAELRKDHQFSELRRKFPRVFS
jgi:hypothetical protein